MLNKTYFNESAAIFLTLEYVSNFQNQDELIFVGEIFDQGMLESDWNN